MASNSVDLALLYSIVAGPHQNDPYSMLQSPVTLPSSLDSVKGIKIGVDWTWAKQANPAVFENFKRTIEYLDSVGCKIISMSIKNIPVMNTGHLVAISAEGSEGARQGIILQSYKTLNTFTYEHVCMI